MSDPYRDSSSASLLACPRCSENMPPGDLRACGAGCGVWVAADMAQQLLTAEELRPSRLTSWARERVGCPMCGTKMALFGLDMMLFQGCAEHGYWLDRDTATQTALGRMRNAALLEAAHARARAFHDELTRDEREARAAEEQRARERDAEARAIREAREEAERAERREQAARAAILEKYITPIQAAAGYGRDATDLAELLARYDRELEALKSRVDELERQLAIERALRR